MAGLTRKSSRGKPDSTVDDKIADAKTAAAKPSSKAPASKPASKAATAKPASKAPASKTNGKAPASKANGKAPATKAAEKVATSKTANTNGKRPLSPVPDEDEEVEIKPVKRTKSQASSVEISAPSKSSTKPAPKPLGRKKSATTADSKAKGSTSKAPSAKATSNELPAPPEHTRPANQLFVWGAGNFGQFGMGPAHLGEFDKPKKNTWLEKKMEEGTFGGEGAGIETISAGGLHTMYIDEKGTIWTCGVNDDAALGRITKDVPNPEEPGTFVNIDTLTSYPYPLQSLVDEGFRAVKITAGDSICAAISDEGELRVWGSFRANEGSLGFSGGAKYQFLPASILKLANKEEKVVSVAAGNNHLVVLTTHGHVYTWGAGEQGQLGRKILERRKIHGTNPEKVTLKPRSLKAVAVGAGNYASFAVDERGDVWGWGLNSMGQVGTGFDEDDPIVPQPIKIDGLSKSELGGATVKRIVGGEHHTLFLTTDGRVYACGRANGGQLGLPDLHPAFKEEGYEGFVAEPTLVPFPDADDPVVHISAGTHNNLAVTESGALYAWGEGNQGELGVGEDTEAKSPTMIVRREGGSWKAITAECGGQHSLGMFRKKTAS